jgi:hypothetical protein
MAEKEFKELQEYSSAEDFKQELRKVTEISVASCSNYTRRRSLLTTASEQHSNTRSRIKNGARIHPAHPHPGRRGDE